MVQTQSWISFFILIIIIIVAGWAGWWPTARPSSRPNSMSDAHVRASYLLQHTLPLLLFRRTQTQTHSPPPPLQTNTNTTHKQNTPPPFQFWHANTNKHTILMLRDKEIHQGKENVKLSNLQTPLPSLFGGFKGVLSKANEWKSGHWLQANPLQGKREAVLRRKESSMRASSSWGREGGRADKGGTGSRGPLSGRGSTGETSPHIHI